VKCDYASCENPAPYEVRCHHRSRLVTWRFCDWHIDDHVAEWNAAELTECPEFKPAPDPNPAGCGTPAGARQHYRRGEKPCWRCAEASRSHRRYATKLKGAA
jgi:hypothetical protein